MSDIRKFLLMCLLSIPLYTGCGGGGGGGSPTPPTPPPPPPPPPPPASLTVSSSSLSLSGTLGEANPQGTFTITNPATSSNTYTVSVDADWVSLSTTSGTLAANASVDITAETSCAEEGTRNAAIEVDGSASATDLSTISVEAVCSTPPLTIAVSESPVAVEGTLPTSLTSALVWTFNSTWDGQGEETYAVTVGDENIAIGNAEGNANPAQVIENSLTYDCQTARVATFDISITVDEVTHTETWQVSCFTENQESITLRVFQGPQIVETQLNLSNSGEWTVTSTNNTKLIAGRSAFLSIQVEHATAVPIPVDVVFLMPQETVLDDVVEVIPYPPQNDDEAWQTEFVYATAGEMIVPDAQLELRIDPENLFIEQNEMDNVISLALGDSVGEFTLAEHNVINIKLVPIIAPEGQPDDIDVEYHLQPFRELLPVREVSVEVLEPYQFEGEDWDAEKALEQIYRLRLANNATRTFYHGIFEHPGSGVCGIAYVGSRYAAVSADQSNRCRNTTFAHEMGHNMNLNHAPGCEAGNPDPNFPREDGSIGDEQGWLLEQRRLIGREGDVRYNDLMNYCGNKFISQYSFNRASNWWTSQSIFSATASAQPNSGSFKRENFALDKSIVVTGAISSDGDWRVMNTELLHGTRPDFLVADSEYMFELLDASSGEILHIEPVDIATIDHSTSDHWSVITPLPLEKDLTYNVVNGDGHVVMFGKLPDDFLKRFEN